MKHNSDIIKNLDDLLIKICEPCAKRLELNRTFGKTFSRIDGYCNKECPTGQQLQSLGKQLTRKKEPA